MTGYVPLRVHGQHTFLRGVDAPRTLLRRAWDLGLPALALTDVDSTAGLVEFLTAAAELEAEGRPVRPIVGAELSDPSGRPGRLVVLVAARAGLANLYRLVSARQLGADPGEAGEDLPGAAHFDLLGAVRRWNAGLVFLADHPRLLYGLADVLGPEQLFAGVSPAALARAGRRSEGERPTELGQARPFELDPSKPPPPEPPVAALELIESARSLELAAVAAPDVYYALEEHRVHHVVRTGLCHNALLCDLPDDWIASAPAHLPAGDELARAYRGLPDAPGPWPGSSYLERSALLAERCRYVPPLGGVHLPEVELPAGRTPYSALVEEAFDGARERFQPLTPPVLRRLEHELESIDRLGYSAYFLLVRQIANVAREREIPCVGRGSAADSLVAYCLGLTDADPLRYRLPFERFLNPRRADRPDIDLDFCWRRRDEVLEAVYGTFGARRTAMIATLNRFGLRAAFREVALIHGVPPVELKRWSKYMPYAVSNVAFDPHDLREGSGGSARSVLPEDLRANPVAFGLASTPECRGFPFEDPRWKAILRASEKLLDVPRHFGLHPGGVVVAPGAITEFATCHRSAKGAVVTQYDKDAVEAVGLVKMDLLGNRALTVIDDARRLLHRRGVEVRLRDQPEDEPRTASALREGRTLGCFQVESPGMRNLLQQIAAEDLDATIQAVALIRPGPAGSGMKDSFIARARGAEAAEPAHPRLAEPLSETHGVMLYQEDVMHAAVALAGLDLADADELRRGTKKRRIDSHVLRQRFFDGCASNDVDAASARRVWEQMANFVSFSFCKAHAVTYGQLAWRTVWLKTHHPAAYLTAFLNSHTGYYQPRVYVEEARRLGVPILGPDVNRSGREFTLEVLRAADGTERDGLRIGLAQVKGLGQGTLDRLLGERARGGAFVSLPDLLERAQPERDEAEHLIRVGACDAFDRTRPELLWRLHLLTEPKQRAPRRGHLPSELDAPLDFGELAAAESTPRSRLSCETGGAELLEAGPPADFRGGVGDTPEIGAKEIGAVEIGTMETDTAETGTAQAEVAAETPGSPAGDPAAAVDGQADRQSPPPGAAEADAAVNPAVNPTVGATGGWGQSGLGLTGRSLENTPGLGRATALFPEPPPPSLALPRLPDIDARSQALEELELLGLTVRLHPTEVFERDDLERELGPQGYLRLRQQRIPCADLRQHVGKRVAILGWLAASRRVRTQDGAWMRFLTFEDPSGLAEVVLFTQAYQRHGHRLAKPARRALMVSSPTRAPGAPRRRPCSSCAASVDSSPPTASGRSRTRVR
ncbi:MAG: DNA polymerase III subunit alpha [Planctomycetota bacterium]